MSKKFEDLVDYFAFLEEKEIIDENGSFSLHPKKMAKGWAENLDIENWEIEEVLVPKSFDSFCAGFTGFAGGDWQDMTRWSLVINDKGEANFVMFDSPDCIFNSCEKSMKMDQFKKLHNEIMNGKNK